MHARQRRLIDSTRFLKNAWRIWFHSRTRAHLKSVTIWRGGPLSMRRWSSSNACSTRHLYNCIFCHWTKSHRFFLLTRLKTCYSLKIPWFSAFRNPSGTQMTVLRKLHVQSGGSIAGKNIKCCLAFRTPMKYCHSKSLDSEMFFQQKWPLHIRLSRLVTFDLHPKVLFLSLLERNSRLILY